MTTRLGIAATVMRLFAAVIVATSCVGGRSTELPEQAGRATGTRLGARPSATDVCPPEDRPVEVPVGGVTRRAVVRVPDDAVAPLPAVVLVHGFAAQADEFVVSSGVGAQADEAGVMVIAPQGRGDPSGWDVLADFDADDAFLTKLLDSLIDSGCIDRHRVAMGGHSAGSAFAAFFGCAHPDRFNALVLNAGLPPPICVRGTPNLVVTHGVDDPVVPYGGGEQRVGDATVKLDSVPDSVQRWADQAGCAADPAVKVASKGADPGEGGPVTWTRWRGCVGGDGNPAGTRRVSVGLAALAGWSHAWPGSVTESGASSGLDDGCVLIIAARTGAPPVNPADACP
ncbi:MAG: PHB depolymerase family esterase [Candidatus Microthrix parvicella]|nr:PHB depolymerase family esterase [Candidatus Microthrix sp.]MBK6502972.1 hypothetical protein [Candidatus Microthrix sp.]